MYKWGWRFYAGLYVGLRRVEPVIGVNSRIDDLTHFLMWDFDGIPLAAVLDTLEAVQKKYRLPEIVVLSTEKKRGGYHAYCFKACSFIEARTIVADTVFVDRHFLAIGIGRGYFTLRFTEFKGRGFTQGQVLPSKYEADLAYSDVNSFVHYTKAK